MDKKASVREIIQVWEKGGINALKAYFNEVTIFENTWADKVKNLIENNHINSVNEEIELVAFNIDLRNKLYKPKKTKESGSNENS